MFCKSSGTHKRSLASSIKKIIMQLIKGAKREYFHDHKLQHFYWPWQILGGQFKQSKPAEKRAKCIEAAQLL